MVTNSQLREVLGCSNSFQEYMHFLLSSWYKTLLPFILLIVLFFVIKKYVKNNKILIAYTIIALALYVFWIIKISPVCI